MQRYTVKVIDHLTGEEEEYVGDEMLVMVYEDGMEVGFEIDLQVSRIEAVATLQDEYQKHRNQTHPTYLN